MNKSLLCGVVAQLQKYGWRLAITLAVLLVGILLVRLIGLAVQRTLCKSRTHATLTGFAAAAVKSVLWLALFLTCAYVAGVPTAPLITLLGSAGLALSLALKDGLSNLAGGIMMMGTKPFSAGDYVEIDGTAGTVKRIKLLHSELVTPDNKTVLLPNNTVINACIVNYSARSTRRVEIPVSAAYGTDPKALRKTVLRTLTHSRYALADPAPVVVYEGTGEFSLDFSARFWVRQQDYWDAYREVSEQVTQDLLRAGITIPYRRLDVSVCSERNEGGGEPWSKS